MTGLIGGVLWALFLLLLTLRTAAEERRVAEELAGLCRLLDALRAELAGASRPLPVFFASFSDAALAGCGFLAALQKEGLCAALRSRTLHPRTARAALPILSPFADALGERLFKEECRAVEEALSRLSPIAHRAAEDAPRRARLGGVLTVSGGLLLLLLFI